MSEARHDENPTVHWRLSQIVRILFNGPTADSIGQSNTSSWRCAHGKTERLDDNSYGEARTAGSGSPRSATRAPSGVLGGDRSRAEDRGRSGSSRDLEGGRSSVVQPRWWDAHRLP